MLILYNLQYVITKHKVIMEKTVIISLRIPVSLLKDIESLTFKRYHWRRNTIIVSLLTCIFKSADYSTIRKMLDTFYPTSKPMELIFREKQDGNPIPEL